MMSLRLRPAAACLAALSLVLSGCALQMPDTEQMMRDVAPQSWSVPLPGKGDPAAMRDFWKNWNDPVLLRLVLRAEEANTDVLTALATLRAARASLLDANAALWPSASIGANAQKDRAQNVTSDTYSAAGDASWTFNLAGSSLSNRNAAYWNALAKQLSAADTRELIAAETAQAYINYRSAQAQLAVIKDSVANYENTAQLAGWRAAAGTSSQAEAEQALVELGTARARIPEIQTSITEYRNALARLTSLPADRLDLGEGPIPEPPAGLASSIPAETLMRRADVQGAVAAVRSAAESLRKSQEDYFPTLTLTGFDRHAGCRRGRPRRERHGHRPRSSGRSRCRCSTGARSRRPRKAPPRASTKRRPPTCRCSSRRSRKRTTPCRASPPRKRGTACCARRSCTRRKATASLSLNTARASATTRCS
jgi:outer membrane protein TolC